MLPDDFFKLVDLVCFDGFETLSAEIKSELKTKRTHNALLALRLNCFNNWKKAQHEILLWQLGLCRQVLKNPHPNVLYYFKSLQRLMDCIVWHNYSQDITDIKRIYEFESKIQNLYQHNIQGHIEVAAEYNSDPEKFALIGDLASGFRLGDIFLLEKFQPPTFIEVKEGDVNIELSEALEQGKDIYSEFEGDPKKIQQAERMVRQRKRSEEAVKILSEGEGVDDRHKKASVTKVFEVKENFITFTEQLEGLLDSLQENTTKSIIVEDSFLVVASNAKNNTVEAIQLEIDRFETDKTIGGTSFDWASVLTDVPFFKPLFLQPIEKSHIQSLAKRETAVIVYFSFERFRKKFSSDEFKIEILQGKNKRQLEGKYRQIGFKGIGNERSLLVYSYIGKKFVPFSAGFNCRVPSYLITPSYLLDMHVENAKRLHKDGLEHF